MRRRGATVTVHRAAVTDGCGGAETGHAVSVGAVRADLEAGGGGRCCCRGLGCCRGGLGNHRHTAACRRNNRVVPVVSRAHTVRIVHLDARIAPRDVGPKTGVHLEEQVGGDLVGDTHSRAQITRHRDVPQRAAQCGARRNG